MQSTAIERQEPQAVEPKRLAQKPIFVPRTDIVETSESIILYADMPGVDEESVELTLNKELLTIEGRVAGSQRDGYRLMHREARSGDFRRSFRVSDDIDVDGIEASVKNGVLRVELPKAKAAKARKIEVSLG